MKKVKMEDDNSQIYIENLLQVLFLILIGLPGVKLHVTWSEAQSKLLWFRRKGLKCESY